MTADISKQTERDLETFFEAVRSETEEASPDLLARVLEDAYAEQDALAVREIPSPAAEEPAAPSRGILRGLWDAIGGWPAAAGLATATVTGVWIGYNPPAAIAGSHRAVGLGWRVFTLSGGGGRPRRWDVVTTQTTNHNPACGRELP